MLLYFFFLRNFVGLKILIINLKEFSTFLLFYICLLIKTHKIYRYLQNILKDNII